MKGVLGICAVHCARDHPQLPYTLDCPRPPPSSPRLPPHPPPPYSYRLLNMNDPIYMLNYLIPQTLFEASGFTPMSLPTYAIFLWTYSILLWTYHIFLWAGLVSGSTCIYFLDPIYLFIYLFVYYCIIISFLFQFCILSGCIYISQNGRPENTSNFFDNPQRI
jgi:hypothetical protein